MDVRKGIKNVNLMGTRIEIINGDGESKIRPIVISTPFHEGDIYLISGIHFSHSLVHSNLAAFLRI